MKIPIQKTSSHSEVTQEDSSLCKGIKGQDSDHHDRQAWSVQGLPRYNTLLISNKTFQNDGNQQMVRCIKEEPGLYAGGDLPSSTSMNLKSLVCPIKGEPNLMGSKCSVSEVHIDCPSVQVKDEALIHEGSVHRSDTSICKDLHHLIKEEPPVTETGYNAGGAFKEELPTSKDDAAPLTGFSHTFSPTRDGKLTKDEACSSKTAHICPVCKRTFDSHGNLTRHRETHKGVKMTCLVCGADFCNKMDLSAHAKEHIASGASRTHACPVCNRTFNSHGNLTKHREAHNGKTMPCKECGAVFCIKMDLAKHARIHRVRRASYGFSASYVCPVCKLTFNGLGNLQKHKERQKGLSVSCVECGANFCNKTDLEAHARKHRAGKVFETFSRDEEENRFTCPHCGRPFANKSSLVEHIKVHTDVKEFCCTVCGKSYTRHEDLLEHHQQAHEEEVSIICSECGLTFVDEDTLDRHLRFHRLHKPFSCEVCGKQYVYKTELIRHERTHPSLAQFPDKKTCPSLRDVEAQHVARGSPRNHVS